MTPAASMALGILGAKHLTESVDGHLSLAIAHKSDRDRIEEELCAAERLADQITRVLHRLRVLNEDARCAEFEEAFERRFGGKNLSQSNVVTLPVAANQGA